MKKFIIFLLAIITISLVACEPDPFDGPYDRRDYEHYGYHDSASESHGNSEKSYTITKLYSIVMRRTLPYPFSAYVLQIDNGSYFYMLRYHFNQDLVVGDKISFGVYSYCQNEIAVINGCELGNGEDATQSSSAGAGEYLIASDPIEAYVKAIFAMKVIYTVPLFPIDTWFIETTDGNLVYVKKSKLNVSLKTGDHFVYNTYTTFPNEILAIKKLP